MPVVREWDETAYDSNCPSGTTTRKCREIDHRDGSPHETVCGAWHCL